MSRTDLLAVYDAGAPQAYLNVILGVAILELSAERVSLFSEEGLEVLAGGHDRLQALRDGLVRHSSSRSTEPIQKPRTNYRPQSHTIA